jgi:hypothetical protein
LKSFHISDVLSATTGRLVSSRHMEGVYDILNFVTGDNLYTHQLPRAMRECEPWLRTQFPTLFPDDPITAKAIEGMETLMADGDTREQRGDKIARWVDCLRQAHALPEMLTVYEMGADMHTRIDPADELRAMVGDDKVTTVTLYTQ